MNHKELFEDYTKASFKTKFTREKAKEYGIAESDIICELLKSGYKLEELKRGAPSAYKSAVKKLDKWKKAGSPSDEDEDVLQRYKKSSDMDNHTEKEGITVEIQKGEVLERNYKYLQEIEYEKDQLETLNGKQAEQLVILADENTKLRERIRGLEEELEDSQGINAKIQNTEEIEGLTKINRELIKELDILRAEKKELSDTAAELNQKLEEEKALPKITDEDRASFDELVKINNDLEESRRKMMKRIDVLQAELNETSQNYNEAMLINRKLEEQLQISDGDLQSEQEHLTSVYEELSIMKKRLAKAERYILDSLYERIGESDDGR